MYPASKPQRNTMSKKNCKDYPDDLLSREQEYRRQGWWSGEQLQDRYETIVSSRGENLAVVDNRGRRLTHNELWVASGNLADVLANQGVCKGEVVIVFLPNWVEWQVALLGILRMGGIPANLPIRIDTDNLRYVTELTGTRAIITTKLHSSTSTREIAFAAAELCEHRIDILFVDENAHSWEKIEDKPLPSAPDVFGLDHIMFTSSTTGRAKAVMHSADTLAALNLTFSERFSLGAHDPIFMASPLGHSVGTIHGARLSLYNGAPLVLQDVWNPGEALKIIKEHDCVFTAAATPFLKDLVEADWKDEQPKLSSMRWFLCGGAQVPTALMEQAKKQFPKTFVTLLWGMTEGGLTTSLRNTPAEKTITTAGVGLPGLEMLIINPEEEQLANGEVGELVMRGPGVFIGYYGQEDLYNSLLTKNGFFRTGDLATLDEAGYLRITGRLKDLIIRGGVNISPVPIEDALSSHPNVSGAAVVGYPEERMGELLCAVIIPEGEIPTLKNLNAFLREKGLPKYHCPELLRIVEKFPSTPAGKIRKAVLREQIINSTVTKNGDA